MVKFLSFKLWSRLFALLAFCGFSSLAFANIPQEIPSAKEHSFPVLPGLEAPVDFWTHIYSKYTTDYAVIHDSRNLDIVYKVVYLGGNSLSNRAKERKLKQAKNKYKKILRRLARKRKNSILSGEEKRVHELVKKDFYQASRNIRSQLGQKDRFERGIFRSGRYMAQIKKILGDYDLPDELSVLPHVESSFHEGAYSSAGAAGIWQFTRDTGRIFMRVRYNVDERRDPITSTYGAAKLLKSNYKKLKSWPLAITAYNHGTQGMMRAKRKFGGDFVAIINKYRSRTFGFASRNFYAEFLAALHVASNEKKYFPGVTKAKPISHVSIRFDDYIHISTVMKRFNMSRNEIAKFNPALRNPVINGQKRIPRGFVFKAPAERFKDLEPFYKKIADAEKFNRQIRSKWYTVQRNDTLSGLALRFGTSVQTLKRKNGIGRKNRIYVGKVIRLPGARTSSGGAVRRAKNHDAGSYRVRKNDNLTKIAKRFGTNSMELARLNGIRNPNSLFPGQRLVVPKKYVLAKASENIIDSGSPRETEKSNSMIKPAKKLKPKIKFDEAAKSQAANIKVQLASLSSPEFRPNTNRPAYLPVTFKSEANKKSRMGEITVDYDETLSHYAEWAQLSIRQVRNLNNIRRSSRIPVHAKIKVPFTNTDPEKFVERRQEFHKAIQDDFFSNYQVSKLVIRKVKKGETLWEICNEMNFIPFWLLSSYNPGKDINSLSLGEPIIIPVITPSKPKDS